MTEAEAETALNVRRLGPADAPQWRALRLDGLAAHPPAFGADVSEEAEAPLSDAERRLAQSRVFGVDAGDHLLGAAGYYAEDRVKTRHIGFVFGFYVRAEARGQGIADAILTALIADAEPRLAQLQLTVTVGFDAALRLYERHGFERFGVSPRSLRVGDRDYDEIMMWRPLTAGSQR